jgi:hypothetical protein
MRID